MDRKDAFSKITSDKALLKRFTENPQQVLQELQVDTSGLSFTKVPKEKAQITSVDTSSPQTLAASCPCASIGCVACISIG